MRDSAASMVSGEHLSGGLYAVMAWECHQHVVTGFALK